MIDDLEAGTFGKVYTMDVKNGGVRLLDLPEEISQEAKDAVAAAQESDRRRRRSRCRPSAMPTEMKAKLAELFPQ